MRPVVSEKAKAEALEAVRSKLERRLQQKGPRSYASTHEILGIVTEEFHELVEAVQSNKRVDVLEELIDIAVACVFGVASHKEGGLEW